jgi:hypothetical protein
MLKKTVFVLMFHCLIFGCAEKRTQSEVRALETREIDAPYVKVYDASLNAMFSLGLSIQHTDKSSGIITGQSGDHVQRESVGWAWRGLYNVKKVTIMVTESGKCKTMVRMKVLINEQPQLDEKLMTDIWQKIEKEAMLTEAFSGGSTTQPSKK